MNTADLDKMNDQFSLKKILLLWLCSAVPMGILTYVITPEIVKITKWPILIVYWIGIIIGLVWQFILSLIVLKYEGYQINLNLISNRLKYQKPINPFTGKASYWFLLWTLPFILISALIQSGFISLPNVDVWITYIFPHFPKYDLSNIDASNYKGAWWLLGLFLITFVFNYFLGEELFYRGVLLPKMNGVFGRWDWFFNGILFGLYHLHKPQVIFSTALYFGFVFALPSKLFQSNWMALIIHGLEGILGMLIILKIIIG